MYMKIFSYIWYIQMYCVPSYKNRSCISHSEKWTQLYCYKIMLYLDIYKCCFHVYYQSYWGRKARQCFHKIVGVTTLLVEGSQTKCTNVSQYFQNFFLQLSTSDFQLLSSGTFGCWTNSKSWNKMHHAYILAGKAKLIEVGPSIKSFTTSF